jgi:hypothetical protein
MNLNLTAKLILANVALLIYVFVYEPALYLYMTEKEISSVNIADTAVDFHIHLLKPSIMIISSIPLAFILSYICSFYWLWKLIFPDKNS